MIRPVLYVDLPSIIRTIDDRARLRHGEFAEFVVAPDIEEPRSGLAAILRMFLPITPNALTWICEDHWRLLGLAQTERRPGAQAWDLTYLAAMAPGNTQLPAAHPDDVLMELLQYSLDAAIGQCVQRFFTRVEDGRGELELFGKLGFQRYAVELSYWLTSAQDGLAALGDSAASDDVEGGDGSGEEPGEEHGSTPPQRRAGALRALSGGAHAGPRSRIQVTPSAPPPAPSTAPTPSRLPTALRMRLPLGNGQHAINMVSPDVSLRPWHRHDAWGLLRLYDACTPKRVQLAENLTSEELVHTRAAGGRTWHLPMLEPASVALVHDRGVRLGGWLRLRYGRGGLPHVLSLMAHPEDPETAPALLRAALRLLSYETPRPILCQVREYETAAVNALRDSGFEHCATHALLVRHLTARALRRREMPASEPRVVYGVKGLGTMPTRLSEGEKTYYAREKH